MATNVSNVDPIKFLRKRYGFKGGLPHVYEVAILVMAKERTRQDSQDPLWNGELRVGADRLYAVMEHPALKPVVYRVEINPTGQIRLGLLRNWPKGLAA